MLCINKTPLILENNQNQTTPSNKTLTEQNLHQNLNDSLTYLGAISLISFSLKFYLLALQNALKLCKKKEIKTMYNLTIATSAALAETILLCGAFHHIPTTKSAPAAGGIFLVLGLTSLTLTYLNKQLKTPSSPALSE